MILSAAGITAGYHPLRPVLRDVSAAVRSGDFVGLIGPNGSGKSTLLRVLSGVLAPFAGNVELDGCALGRLSTLEHARAIAFVPQAEATAFDYTVEEVVLMGRYPHRHTPRAAQDADSARAALAATDALHLAHRPITRLSGGEHRRVLLARALAQGSPLLLLDEPTAHLDIAHRAAILQTVLLRAHGPAGAGAIAALHDLGEAADFCDRMVLLAAGSVVAAGSPDEVLTPGNLSPVFGADIRVVRNPVTGRPLPLSAAPASGRRSDQRAHVVCGGGTGVAILAELVRAGFIVTAGALNCLDADEEAARALGVECALEAPFSPIGADAAEAARRLMSKSSVVVVAPVPIGQGNLVNLRLALEAQQQAKQIVLLQDAANPVRDFTQGEATRLLDRLAAAGAVSVGTVQEWLAQLPAAALEE